MTAPERRERALKWLDTIVLDVQETIVNHHIFWEVQEIIHNNAELATMQSAFFEWMGSVFAHSAAVAVRRQIKSDHQSISLLRLLEELKKYPAIITREYFVSICADPSDPLSVEYAYDSFDSHAGQGKSHLDPVKIEADIQEIKDKAKVIEHYVDKRIAHYDEGGVKANPKFSDLDECLRCLEKLLRKYKVIMQATDASLYPHFLYDWKQIFRLRWIT